jgi:uncharacterized membrane protein
MSVRIHDATTNDESHRLLERSSTLLSVGVLLAMLAASALAYASLPEAMTIQWRMGIDGSVTTRTVGRTLGVTALPAIAAMTWLAIRAVGQYFRSHDDMIGVLCSVFAVATVVLVGFIHLLVLGLNLV